MRFLLDENVPTALAAALAGCGADALVLPAALRGAPDRDVLAAAVAMRRALVTLDQDFGALVFQARQETPEALVLIRMAGRELLDRVDVVARAIRDATVAGTFVVIGNDSVRVRPLR